MLPPLVLTADLDRGVVAGFTARAGGCSTGDWGTLNLALHVGDDSRHVTENRRRVANAVGAPVVFGRQVHGVRCALLPDEQSTDDPLTGDLGANDGGYDALVATTPETAVGVLVADCVPVLLADAEVGVVATAHAGRVGLLAGVLTSVLARMQQAGARPGRIRAALGPAADPCCYEVPEALHEAATAALPALRSRTTAGTPSLDLRAGCRAVLIAAGVSDVRSVGGCTIEDDAFYSYRRSRVTGRFAGVVKMVG